MSDEGMKVTDKRMFTPEGELREEYRFLEERARERAAQGGEDEARRGEEPAADAAAPSAAPPEAAASPAQPPGAEAPLGPAPGLAGERPDAGAPPGWTEAEGGAPVFFDLLGVLAEPVPFYLGDARLPTGESGENLEAARFYIDLLEVLKTKTEGNLEPQEADALEDLLYRLRLRYVQKRR
ncbi:MAG TPA: DUF1844 domain-containing protein [Thermoanaerobaculia bacterium]